MGDLIRWGDSATGGHLSGFLGYVGALDEHLFRIWAPAPNFSDEWTLNASPLPGRPKVVHGTDLDELKVRAEELLREWVSSLGAAFPEPEPGPGGYVAAYSGHHACRYCPEPAKWDVAGFLSCPDLAHLARALEYLTARTSIGDGQ